MNPLYQLDIDLKLIHETRRQAGNFYSQRQLDSAVIAFESCLEKIIKVREKLKFLSIASSERETEREIKEEVEEYLDEEEQSSRYMLGCTQSQKGLYLEALATLSPFLASANKNEYSSEAIFSALTQYIEIAQKIPIPLEKINSAYKEVEQFLKPASKNFLNHEMLVFKARFLFLKGEHEKAALVAKEAIIMKDYANKSGRYDSGQVWDFHYDGLVTSCLALNRADKAAAHINEWSDRPDQMERNRLIRMNKCLADLNRSNGAYPNAIEFGLRAVYYAENSNYEETKFSSYCALFYAYFYSEMFDFAHLTLGKLLKMRFSKRLFIRYQIQLIILKLREKSASKSEKFINSQQTLTITGSLIDKLLLTNYYSGDFSSYTKTYVY